MLTEGTTLLEEPNAELQITPSHLLPCSDHGDYCGELPAALSMGTVTHNRTPYTSTLWPTSGLSGVVGAYQSIPLSSSRCCYPSSVTGQINRYAWCFTSTKYQLLRALFYFTVRSSCKRAQLYYLNHAACAVQLAANRSMKPICVLQSVSCTTSAPTVVHVTWQLQQANSGRTMVDTKIVTLTASLLVPGYWGLFISWYVSRFICIPQLH